MGMADAWAIVFTGLAIVFLGLLLLIAFVSLFGFVLNPKKKKDKKSENSEEKAAPVSAVAAPAPVVEDGIEEEIVAVISAAVASMADGNLAVKSIKRSVGKNSPSRSAWATAGILDNTRSF